MKPLPPLQRAAYHLTWPIAILIFVMVSLGGVDYALTAWDSSSYSQANQKQAVRETGADAPKNGVSVALTFEQMESARESRHKLALARHQQLFGNIQNMLVPIFTLLLGYLFGAVQQESRKPT